uniref:Mitochondrial inner membrane protein Mpv17 n=1 Tax=Gongylonema pulchrum TaxID=637853 RepID=A0A183EEW0_9BILA
LLLEKMKGNPRLLPLKRMIVDQASSGCSCGAPIFTFTFITNLHMLEGKRPREALHKASNEIVPVMKTNYKVWPFAQLFNFYVLPLRYRVVFVQFIGLFWNMYLSYATQAEVKKGKRSKEEN